MGKERLKMVDDGAAPRSAGRQSLADAIARVGRLESDLGVAQDAAGRAKSRKRAASAALEALAAAAPEREDVAERFIAALASGEPGDVATLPPHKDDIARQYERQAEHFGSVETACAQVASDTEHALVYARREIEKLADSVIGEEDPLVAKLIDEAEQLQAKLIERRLALRFYASKNLIADDALRDRVRKLMTADLPAPLDVGSFGHKIFDAHPVSLRLAAARDALKADAWAPLPGDAV